jgi:uncharacterized protein (TIGR03435 family)
MSRTFPMVSLFLLVGCAGDAQPADPKPKFEAASVEMSPQAEMSNVTINMMKGGPGTNEPGRFTAAGTKLSALILRAYGVQRFRLIGPDWLESESYEIIAIVPGGSTREQFALMLQRLLEERFKLAVHKEQKEMPGYELKVAEGGPRLTELVEEPAPFLAPPGARPPAIAGKRVDKKGYPILSPDMTGRIVMKGHATEQSKGTMEQFARFLTNMLGQPVTDATGLQGKYQITLRYIQDMPMGGTGLGGLMASADNDSMLEPALKTPAGPTLFGALQSQVGLKLEPKTAMMEMLVVDHAERVPTTH